ncbi:hypothetical protein J11TS1_14590 [Oceanobacillus sp. J11TS1]|nr:hypothetical protein J11TS1_14590 [Oceanobacillus sp. J11TS1]
MFFFHLVVPFIYFSPNQFLLLYISVKIALLGQIITESTLSTGLDKKLLLREDLLEEDILYV